MKRLLSLLLAVAMLFALVACGGNHDKQNHEGAENHGGTQKDHKDPKEPIDEGPDRILWLTDMVDGDRYDTTVAYLEALCNALGYNLTVVHGDAYNDAANNLLAVKNAVTADSAGLIISQDGGLADIMEAYPQLWVAGFGTDMRSVYEKGGENAACLENPKFLGTIAEGGYDGAVLGAVLAQQTIDAGFKKVALVIQPEFAHPAQTEAVEGYTTAIEEYNAANPDDVITIVGQPTALLFGALSEQWFLESGHSELDAIISFCEGLKLVYPTMVSAMEQGLCSEEMRLISVGFERDQSVTSDLGGGGRIYALTVSRIENCAYPLILIDNAVHGKVAAGTENSCVDGTLCLIDSAGDIADVMANTMLGTGNVEDACLSVEKVVSLCGRNHPDLTWAGLIALFQSFGAEG